MSHSKIDWSRLWAYQLSNTVRSTHTFSPHLCKDLMARMEHIMDVATPWIAIEWRGINSNPTLPMGANHENEVKKR